MNRQQIQRSHSAKCRAPPPPSTLLVNNNNNYLNSEISSSSSLPDTFISSLRQLFSILDKTNSGYIPLDLFKRYFDCSSLTSDFLNKLEIESKSNNHLITFNLLINVIEQSLLLSSKASSSILIPKVKYPFISCQLNRSPSLSIISPKEKKISTVYQSSNGLEMNKFHISNPIYYKRKIQQNNKIDFSMIRALKRYEIEYNLLIQTCNTLDRVKFYLIDRLIEMKDKQKIYCRYLSTTDITGIVSKSMYNRDLVADLFKLANTVIGDVNNDFKKLSNYSSVSLSLNGVNNQYERQLKAKDDQIKQLETEKHVLLKEIMEMKQQKEIINSIEIL